MWYNLSVDIVIDSYLPKTSVEGPGTRFCIWVQGCSLRCVGCANSHMWDKNRGKMISTDSLVSEIYKYKDDIEGITFLGGEPLEQIKPVTEISKVVREMGLTVLIFTGYDYSLIKDREDVKELVKYTDILIDGKFEKEKLDYSRPWVGSTNQKYYFFSDRYNEDIIDTYKNKFELYIDKDNKVRFNGMGDFEKLKEVLK